MSTPQSNHYNQFSATASLHPGRSVFDLSCSKIFNCDMGQLIPVYIQEVVPGDHFRINADTLVRFQPLVAPVMHDIHVVTEYFFVPYRLLWKDWEKFITRGQTGDETLSIPEFTFNVQADVDKFSLWDYFGFPTSNASLGWAVGVRPIIFPWYAYMSIWDQYYRDQDLQESLLDDEGYPTSLITSPLNCAWEKDYFTVSRPWQQRGTAPAVPISGFAPLKLFFEDGNLAVVPQVLSPRFDDLPIAAGNLATFQTSQTSGLAQRDITPDSGPYYQAADLSGASTFTPADLRLAFQIQKWQELNARAGVRYTEFLRSHFNVSPTDDRLQRPEFIGGVKHRVMFSEVLQTSQTSSESPQGNLAGHGITADSSFVGKYYAQEFGIIMGLMRVVPRTMYQQGINRQWLRKSSWDFYFPEFAHLSEQPVLTGEIYAGENAVENLKVFGYQERFGEMRINYNTVAGDMRDKLDYWHLGRKFSTSPTLGSDFVTCKPDKRIFAVQDEPGLIITHTNRVTAVRPLPRMGVPGLIDHA